MNCLRSQLGPLSFLLSVILSVFILMGLTGCGEKKPAPHVAAVESDSAKRRVASWYELMRAKRDAAVMEKLNSVNAFFNRLEYVDDLIQWGKTDYWASPREMLMSNGGDCEDFATAKYFTLRQLGVSDNKLRLTYVKSLKLNQPHMVLTYYADPKAEPLVLDNFTDDIIPASERPDLLPVYSFNGEGYWLERRHSSERLGGPEHLSLWQDLRARFNREAVAAPPPD